MATRGPGTPLGLPKRRQFTEFSVQPSGKSKLSGFSRTSTTGRSSVAIKPRGSHTDSRSSRSSVYGQGIPTLKKDPRPLNDKSFQQASIKKIHSFLVGGSYPREVKPRTLQSLSTKEFLYILNFILELHDPSLIVNGIKLEEEIPFVLKFLGYPFTVSKNHLLSIGSPHSLPVVLGVLLWLIETVPNDYDFISDVLFPKDNFDKENRNESEFEEMTKLYHKFLEVGDEDEQFKDLLKQRNDRITSTYDEKRSCKEELIQEMTVLDQKVEKLKEDSVGSAKQQLDELKHQHEINYKYAEDDLVPRIQLIEQKSMDLKAEIEKKRKTIEAQKGCIQELQEKIKKQPISSREAQQLRKEIKDKNDSLGKLLQMKQESLQRVNELQMMHNQSVYRIDMACREVNDQLRELTATIPDASCLTPLDYNTSKRADVSVLNQLAEQAKAIKNGLQLLIDKVSTKSSETEKNLNILIAHVSALENEMVKQRLELEENDLKVEREEALLEQAKKNLEEAMRMDITEKSDLETQLVKLQQELDDRSVEKDVALAKAKIEEDTIKMSDDLAEMTSQMQELLVLLTQYLEKEKIKEHKFEEQCRELIAIYNSIEPPAVKAKYLS